MRQELHQLGKNGSAKVHISSWPDLFSTIAFLVIQIVFAARQPNSLWIKELEGTWTTLTGQLWGVREYSFYPLA